MRAHGDVPTIAKQARSGLLVIMVSLALAGCAMAPPPRAPAPSLTLRVKLPTFAPMPETKELQAKGGIQISAAAVIYEVVRSQETSDQDASPSFTDKLNGPRGWQTMRFVERTSRDMLTVKPDRLEFRLTINNQLPRVFRGAGTVVQFAIAGKVAPGKTEDYGDLMNTIIPPRGQQQVTIYGPPLSALEDQTTIGLFLYDVVTKTDAAGTPTERQNFEWYFSCTPQVREEAGQSHTQRLWVR